MKKQSIQKNGDTKQVTKSLQQSISSENQNKWELSGIRKPVENTLFATMQINENTNYILMGNNVLKTTESEEESLKLIENKDWELILLAGIIYRDYIEKQRAEEKLK